MEMKTHKQLHEMRRQIFTEWLKNPTDKFLGELLDRIDTLIFKDFTPGEQ